MKFTHFIWDFDGTLFDTYPRINSVFQQSLREEGLDVSMETLIPLTKVNLHYACKALAPELEDAVMARYRQHAKERLDEPIFPFPGVKQALQSIHEQGGHNYLYTLSGPETIRALEAHGMKQYFTDFVTRADGFPNKPAPDAVLHLVEKHHLDKAECVMVGDRDIDLLSGTNAGISAALYDAGHFYDHFDVRYRYTTMQALTVDLIWEQEIKDLRISDLFSMQRELQQSHPEWGGVVPARLKPELLWMVGEIGEVIDVVKKAKQEVLLTPSIPRERFIEEMVDVAMYFNDVLLCAGVSAEEFAQAYYAKHQHNLKRDYQRDNAQRYGK